MRVEHIGPHMPWVRIYALCEPDQRIRYVGKTVQWLHMRHKAHIRAAEKGGRLPVHYWLRKQITKGAPLVIKLLENVADGADWVEREKAWIAIARSQSPDILNLTDGGEGLSGHRFTEGHKSKIAAKLRTGVEGACEVCGARTWRKSNEMRRSLARFCSRRCANGRHKGRGLFDA